MKMRIIITLAIFAFLLLLTSKFTLARFEPPVPPLKPIKSIPLIPAHFNWQNEFVSNSSIYGGSLPEVAYGRGRFGVIFEDHRDGTNEIYFSLLNLQGEKIGEDLRITNDPGASWNPTITFSGHEFGIFWYDNPVGSQRGIYYASVDTHGRLRISPTRINDANADGVHPSAVWNKKMREYGVAWWDSRVGGTYFARVDRNGNVVKETVISTLAPQAYYRPLITVSDNEYALAWGYNVPCGAGSCPEMAFGKVSLDGTKIGTDQIITAFGATRPKSILWNGSEYAVLVGIGHYAKLLRVSQTGEIIEPPIFLGWIPMSNAHMIWTSRQYVVTWIDGDVKLQTFDRNGNSTHDPIPISQTDGPNWNSSTPVQVGWRGNGIGIAWIDKLYESNQAIYFAQGRF